MNSATTPPFTVTASTSEGARPVSRSAPSGDSTFKTVNGKVELALPRDVAAEVAVETLHGDLYSDFEVEAVPVKAVAERESGNARRYRYTQDMVVRIGGGGSKSPVRLDCTTVNGDVVVRAR